MGEGLNETHYFKYRLKDRLKDMLKDMFKYSLIDITYCVMPE